MAAFGWYAVQRLNYLSHLLCPGQEQRRIAFCPAPDGRRRRLELGRSTLEQAVSGYDLNYLSSFINHLEIFRNYLGTAASNLLSA